MERMGCKIKKVGGYLHFRIFWNRLRIWQRSGLEDTPENLERVNAAARLIAQEIKDGCFDYMKWFPKGNKAHLFRRNDDTPSFLTVEAFFKTWIKEQSSRVRPHRVKDYESQFRRHILPAIGRVNLAVLSFSHLLDLQRKLKAKGMKAASVNGVVHGSLRAMLKAARGKGTLTRDLYDKAFLSPLPLTDSHISIDPYDSDEREAILEAFKSKRAHCYPFVYFQFWTGARPSETTALRWQDVDLRYGRVRIERSRVQGHEAGTKTKRSKREIHLHANLADVLRSHKPLHVKPSDYVFTTPAGTPIDEQNFLNREWLPTLRAKEIRPRPFYNTRHSYTSFLVSIGARSGFISAQTGDSIKTLEEHYAKYLPDADSMRDLVESSIQESAKSVQSGFLGDSSPTLPEKKKPLRNKGLKNGAGEEGRTPDLMLGKHTL